MYLRNTGCPIVGANNQLRPTQKKMAGPYCYAFLSYYFRRTAALSACRPTITCNLMGEMFKTFLI